MLWFPILDTKDHLDAAPAGEDGIAVAMLFGSGVHVFVQQADGTAIHWPLPETGALVLEGCPKPAAATPEVQSRPCTETGDGVTGHALTATADGLWLAYVRRHVDHDVIQSCWFDEGVTCKMETVTDRSSAEVVVVRVPTDAAPTSAPAIVWRSPIAETPDGPVAMDGRGNRLALALMSGRETTKLKTIRYVLLDAGAL